MNIVVLHGHIPETAPKDELDVLVQAEAVSLALSELGHTPLKLAFSLDIRSVVDTLQSLNPHVVFNLVESVGGSGRLVHLAPAILDHLNLTYTGGPTEAIFCTSYKLEAKRLFTAFGIDTPRWVTLEDLDQYSCTAHRTYIIKSAWEHASVGLDEESVINACNAHHLLEEMEKRRVLLGGACFAEEFIPGREFNISLLGLNNEPQILPPAEILFDYPEGKYTVVGYRAKWEEGSYEYHHTPRCFEFPKEDDMVLKQLKELSRKCWKAFGLRGYARVDFRVDDDRRPWVLEINVNPCISPDSGFIAAAERAGLSYNQVIDRIVREALATGKRDFHSFRQ